MRGTKKKIESARDAVEHFKDHEGVSQKKVESWIKQFGPKNHLLAYKLLSNIIYYNGSLIRDMVYSSVNTVKQKNRLENFKNTIFIPIGKVSDGSFFISRALRGLRGIYPGQIKQQTDLANLNDDRKTKCVIFLDVISGSGKQITDWWDNLQSLILPLVDKAIMVSLCILVVTNQAKSKLKQIPLNCYSNDFLDEKFNTLSQKTPFFTNEEKKIIKAFCKKTKCTEELVYGKGGCGLLVVFKHGCPNNSLPILWYDKSIWKNLFKRRAL